MGRRPRPVLGRTDPDYRRKLKTIQDVLARLPEDETAVFQDEVDVLPERSAEALNKWLQKHSELESSAGIRATIPQVTDRWHFAQEPARITAAICEIATTDKSATPRVLPLSCKQLTCNDGGRASPVPGSRARPDESTAKTAAPACPTIGAV